MKNFYLIFVLLISIGSFAQQSTYSKVFKNDTQLEAYDAVQTIDSGYVIVGMENYWNGLIVRVDSLSNEIWNKTVVPVAGQLNFTDVIATYDSCYVVSGVNDMQSYAVKINDTGDTLWTHSFGGFGQHNADVTYAVELLDSSLLFVWGNYQENAFHLAHLDAAGNVNWAKRYEGPNTSTPRCIYQLSDSCIYIGTAANAGIGILHKLAPAGQLLWSKTYDGIQIHDLVANDNSIYLLGVNSSFTNAGVAAKIDTAGTVSWSNYYGGYFDGTGTHLYVRGYFRADSNIVMQVPSLMAGGDEVFLIDTLGQGQYSSYPQMGSSVVLAAPNLYTIFVGNGPTWGIKLYEPHFGVIRADSLFSENWCAWPSGSPNTISTSINVSSNTFTDMGAIPTPNMGVGILNTIFNTYEGCVDFLGEIDEQGDLLNVSVYPNASTGIFSVDFEATSEYKLSVYSPDGSCVQMDQIVGNHFTLDLTNNAPGLYLFKVIDLTNGRSNEGKLVLK